MKTSKIIKIISMMLAVLLLASCGAKKEVVIEETEPEIPEQIVQEYESNIGKLSINEVMPKNKATIMDDNGEFTDWVEIQNTSDETLDLTGWTINGGKKSTTLDGKTLDANQLLLIFLPISDDVTVFDPNGEIVDKCETGDKKSDQSLVKNPDGSFSLSKYPTPGLPNSAESFDYLQSQNSAESPVIISEVCVENFSYSYHDEYGYSDWIELKNISDESLDLSGWCITDNLDNPSQYVIPQTYIDPNEEIIIFCNNDVADDYSGTTRIAPFSLDSENERIYLINPNGEIADYTPLRDIPYGMSYGRIDGENGFFYMTETPGHDNVGDEDYKYARRVAESPVALSKDGVFEDVKKVSVELSSDNEIYYTTDGTIPTEESEKYTGPFEVEETCIVRAVSVQPGAIDSRPITLNYIINEGDNLPVVCVVADNQKEFRSMYENGQKEHEMAGVISYYGDNGTFTIGAGIKMHGFSTLVMPKKNLSFRFRGCYGQESLDFDVFEDGGVTNFTNLLLRAGGDQLETIVKNEVCINIAREVSDNVPAARNRYVVMYLNGKYNGIYSLTEKTNEQWYADLCGVDKSSVTMVEEPAYQGNIFYQEVQSVIYYEDMSKDENYEALCQVLDIDSLIDWTILQGFFANWDLMSGNLRYVKSTDTDGKWRLVLYDLDNGLTSGENCFVYTLGNYNTVSAFNTQLLKNANYKQKFLERSSQLLKGELTAERVWEEYEKLSAVIDKDAQKDETISYKSWLSHLEKEHDVLLEDYDWYVDCAKMITYACHLNNEQKIQWFGDF